MTAQKQPASYGELIAELNHERKHSAELEKKLATCEKFKMKYKANYNTEKGRADILQSKLEKLGYKHVGGVSDEDEKKIIIEEVSRNAKKGVDAAEILYVILRLQYVDRFWQVVKHQSIESITRLIRGMTDEENYERVVSNLSGVSIYAKIKED